ncbi:MAG: ATP phosphoribosyltransferase regulatory subunit [Cyanobacteriota bacterium]
MALQPAAGVRDLNPGEVERNRRLCGRLADVYRRWGYRQVAPPTVERTDTLEAGGAIGEREVVRLVSGEPLGLRPELTAPIARAATTRLVDLPRPLRLWSEGTIFRNGMGDAGPRIQEQLQSGVELLGDPSAAAEAELLRLLLAAAGSLGLEPAHRPQLLLGHHGLLSLLLERVPEPQRPAARTGLCSLNALDLAELPLAPSQRQWLAQLSRLRGEPSAVLNTLGNWIGEHPLLRQLQETLDLVVPAAARQGVTLQLDPSFQPHFALYDGLVLKLVCQGRDAPVEIASGGRYDALVGRFQTAADPAAQSDRGLASGVGFGFDIEAVRELPGLASRGLDELQRHLVAYSPSAGLAAALDALEQRHREGMVAELHGQPLTGRGDAERMAAARGCHGFTFLA